MVTRGLFDIDPSIGSSIDIALSMLPDCISVPLRVSHEPVFEVSGFNISLPLFLMNNGIRVMLSSIDHTSEFKSSPGFARSDAEIIILFPDFRV
jgi:hypothetical protein